MGRAVAPLALALASCSWLVDTGPYVVPRDPAVDASSDAAPDARMASTPDAEPDHPDADVDAGKPAARLVSLGSALSGTLWIGRDDVPSLFVHVAPNVKEAGMVAVVTCTDSSCSDVRSQLVEAVGPGAPSPRALIDERGTAWLAYHDARLGQVKLRRCRDEHCDESDVWVLPGAGAQNASDLAFTLSSEGFPMLAYHDPLFYELHAVLCQSAYCCDLGVTCEASTRPPEAFRITAQGGLFAALGPSHMASAVVTFHDLQSHALVYIGCVDVTCQEQSRQTIERGEQAGLSSQVLVSREGLASIFYYEGSAGVLKLATCQNPSCDRHEKAVLDGGDGHDVGTHIAAKFDRTGRPLVAYRDRTRGALKVLHCTGAPEAPCETRTVETLEDGDDSVFTHTSIDFVPSSGLPVVAYRDDDAGTMKLAFCHNEGCRP